MIKNVVQILFFLFAAHQVCGQKIITQHYSIPNGLPSNEVFSVLKDKIGFIWLATDRGLCRFDGKTFKIYTVNEGLSENSTLEVREDKLGRIWCRSYSGLLTVIDRDSVYAVKINQEIKNLNIGLVLYQFEFDDSLNLYLATRKNGLVYKSPYPYEKVNPMPLDKGGITFFQISDTKHITSYSMGLDPLEGDLKTVIALKGKTLEKTLSKDHLKENFFLRYVYTPHFLVVSTNEFINTFSLQSEKFVLTALPFQVSSLSLLSDSTVFVGGFKGELAIFNIHRNTFKIVDKFPSSISSIYFHNNTCWVTTLRNGVYYIPNIYYEVFADGEPLISMLPVSNDSLYLLNANSEIKLINHGKIDKLPHGNSKKSLMYWQRFDHLLQDYIPFIGSVDYLTKRTTQEKIKLNCSAQIYQSEFAGSIDSVIYKGFYKGLCIFNQKGTELQHNIEANGRLTCVYGHKGVLYLGTLTGTYQLVNHTSVLLGEHSFFKNRVAAIDKMGDDTLIIATQANGIGIYEPKTKKLKIIDNISGLDKLIIQHAYVDEAKKIWIATQHSIHVLKLDAKEEHRLLDVIDLSTNNLSIKEVRTLNGIVYILAGNQVIKIPEKRIKFNNDSYPVVLNEFLINGKKVPMNDARLGNLSPNENNLQVKFQLLSYSQNQILEYRYRLNNELWVYTSNNELQLASLPSATYTLEIQGRLKNGTWNSATPIHFVIEQPFYQKTGFIILSLLCTLAGVYFFLSQLFKTKYQKKVKEYELKRELESARLMASKSQMNPHFVFNALNSIQNFIIKSDKIQAYQYLTDFSTLIRNYLEYSNKDYINLDKELALIETYIKIEQLRIPFHFELHVDEHIKTSSEYIFNLLLQPCLENAIWHGLNHKTGEKKLLLTLKKKNNCIEIEITDNGIGRAKSAVINMNRVSKPKSVATHNMQTRINSLRLLYKNDISINILDNFDDNSESTGTTVLIKFEQINENG